LLYQVCDQIRQHAGNRLEAFLPLIKGSQAEIMAVTADLDLTLSQGRILLELERTGEALAVNDLASRISLSIAAAGWAIRCESYFQSIVCFDLKISNRTFDLGVAAQQLGSP
jgi:hypothetical protein